MAHTTIAQAPSPSPAGPAAVSVLMKPDRPRSIDRFIDYFGGANADLCGEALLDETDELDLGHEEVA